ncbi:MAG: ATP-binding cassette domain-containing protein, partial [Bdellovibrionales bacterium]|nr:ATP-binding cassette domain-containing protein [Bdellovibrionales bacterium]
ASKIISEIKQYDSTIEVKLLSYKQTNESFDLLFIISSAKAAEDFINQFQKKLPVVVFIPKRDKSIAAKKLYARALVLVDSDINKTRFAFIEPVWSLEKSLAVISSEYVFHPPLVISTYSRIIDYLKPHKKEFFASLICMVFYGASDGAIPFIVKHILDGIFTNHNTQLLYLLPLAVMLFAIFRAATDFGQQFLMARVGHKIVRDIRNAVNRHLLKLSPGYFISQSSGGLLSRITSDVVLVKTLLTSSTASLIRDFIRILTLIAAAIYLDSTLASIALIAVPAIIFPVYRFGRRIRKLTKLGQDAIGALSSLLHESILGNKVVRIFGRESFEEQRFANKNNQLTDTFVKSERIHALAGPVNEILAALAISIVILWGGSTVIHGSRSQGDFIAFLLSIFLLYEPLKRLSKLNNSIQEGLSGAERIFEVLDRKPDIIDPQTPKLLSDKNSIEFCNVDFRYNRGGPLVLKDVSLTVDEGSKVALVGFSGAGKSTLIDLIPRFMDPTAGKILVGGIDLRLVKIAELRSRIASVGQHTFLFNDSVFNNIRYGKEDATEMEVHAAAKAAFATEFIEELSAGFNTIIGEGGLTLSGGQRQRLAIARAILKDAPILILDEATASLDNKSEKEVQAALEALEKNRTSIIIAHRLSTIINADKIIVMHEGRIVEVGTHQELLNLKGSYSKLYALQFSTAGETLKNEQAA